MSDEVEPERDVYAPPGEETEALPAEYRLYSATMISLFGCLFGPLIGGGMAAVNYGRSGQPKKAQQTVMVSIGCVAVIAAIAYFFGDSGSIVRGATIGGTVGFAMSLRVDQKRIVEQHLAAGGRLELPILPALIGLGLVVVALFFLGVI